MEIKHEYIKITFYDEERKKEHTMTMALVGNGKIQKNSYSTIDAVRYFFDKALAFYLTEFDKEKGEQ